MEGTELEKPDVAGHEREVLDSRISRRLGETQTLLLKEVVLWKHGFLAIPKVRTSLKMASPQHYVLCSLGRELLDSLIGV